MSERIAMEMVPVEQALNALRHHVTMWHGYAFALAQKANLSPEEAAHFFMEGHAPIIVATPTDPAMLAQYARQTATTLALIGEGNNVFLEQVGERWLIKSVITADRPNLERWGAALDFFVRWLAEHSRMIGEPKRIEYTLWLDGDVLHVQLALRPNE